MNGYNEGFVQRTLQRAMKKRSQRKPDLEQPKATAVIPYVRGLSEQVSKELRKIGIREVSKANTWECKLCVGIKDEVPIETKKGVHIVESQLGEIARPIKVRTLEHERHFLTSRQTQ